VHGCGNDVYEYSGCVKCEVIMNEYNAIDLTRLDEEIISPKEFLELNDEQRRNILKVTPFVRKLGTTDIRDSNFAFLKIKWKIPKYKVRL
jgi:hypothetical protein